MDFEPIRFRASLALEPKILETGGLLISFFQRLSESSFPFDVIIKYFGLGWGDPIDGHLELAEMLKRCAPEIDSCEDTYSGHGQSN